MIVMPINSWTSFKNTVLTNKQLELQYSETASYYEVYAQEAGMFVWTISLLRDGGADVLDFENNYKAMGNKTISQQNRAFASKILPNGKKLYKRVHGIQAAVVQGVNNILFTIPYPTAKITGLEIVGATSLDYCDFLILDSITGTYTGIPNYQLNQFGFSVNLSSGFYNKQNEYDADLYQGMQLKLIYNSVDAKTVGINFLLHEVKI